MLAAVTLSLVPSAAKASRLIGSTINFGFYISGNLFDPARNPIVLYPDQTYDNVLVTNGAKFLFSNVGVACGAPCGGVTFTSVGTSFTNLVADSFPTSVFAG